MELTSVSKVILGALRSGERSGYEIKRLVDNSTRFFWAASYGQIYPELRRLESAALVEGSSAPRGGRARRVYTLTPAGQTAIQDWLTDPEVGYELRDEALLKLFFADALSAEQALALVRAIRAHRERVLARMRELEGSLPAEAEGFPLVVLEYGIELHEWMVSWCGRTERRLASRARTAGREAGAA
jgi:PadR family transcriptional regulator AphA